VWERTYKQLKAQNKSFEFVGVGLLDSEQNSRGFVARHALTFPNLYDANGDIARAYGFTSQPYTAWIDAAGNVVRQGRGPTTEAEFRQLIEQHIR